MPPLLLLLQLLLPIPSKASGRETNEESTPRQDEKPARKGEKYKLTHPPSLPPILTLSTKTEGDAPASDDATAAPAAPTKSFKGFGEKPAKKAPPPKTKGQLEREKYASAYDTLASKGVPEYAVYIKEAEAGEKDWKFVGSMAVPRNAKVDQAIYENEVRPCPPSLPPSS